MPRAPHPTRRTSWPPNLRALLTLVGVLLLLLPSHVAATPTTDWTLCLLQSAESIKVPVELLQAIVEVESHGHPWAFGWKQPNGTWTSWTTTSYDEAERKLRDLWATTHSFDVGLAQINSRNLERFWRTHGISPLEALHPCTNLYLSSLVLQEQVAAHGYTWRAISGYNGSSRYASKIWHALCDRTPLASCQ